MTDVTARLQQAIDAASAEGLALCLPPSTDEYITSAPLRFPSGSVFAGPGPSLCRLRNEDTVGVQADGETVNNVQISGIHIEGPDTLTNTLIAWDLRGWTYSRLENCSSRFQKYGVRFSRAFETGPAYPPCWFNTVSNFKGYGHHTGIMSDNQGVGVIPNANHVLVAHLENVRGINQAWGRGFGIDHFGNGSTYRDIYTASQWGQAALCIREYSGNNLWDHLYVESTFLYLYSIPTGTSGRKNTIFTDHLDCAGITLTDAPNDPDITVYLHQSGLIVPSEQGWNRVRVRGNEPRIDLAGEASVNSRTWQLVSGGGGITGDGQFALAESSSGNTPIVTTRTAGHQVAAAWDVGLQIHVRSDATRGAAGTAGRVIYNTTNANLNIDDGVQWILPDGTPT